MITLTEKQQAKKDYYLQQAEKFEQMSTELWNQANKMQDVIPFGQPILVGHHSENRDRSYRNRIDSKRNKSIEYRDKAEYYRNKAERIGTGGISSDDENAIEKLKTKLEKLEKLQKFMKEANKICKCKKLQEVEKVDKLTQMGLSESSALNLLEPNWTGYGGFERFQLSNNNATIRNTKKRIEELEAKTQMKNEEKEIAEGCILKTNIEENRYQFLFDDKPSEEVRTYLKRNLGLMWSPYNKAWQRKITGNAQYAIKYNMKGLIELLNKKS